MFPQIIDSVNNNPKLKKALYGIGIFLAVVIIFFSFKPKASADQYNITSVGLKDSVNFTKLSGTSLFYYNGSGFYKKDISSGEQTTLSTGLRLPTPNNIFWADEKGVMLSFKGSYYYTTLEDKLKSEGLRIDKNTKNYTWYLDFETNQLSLVAPSLVKNSTVAYSEEKQGFYFMHDDFQTNIDDEFHTDTEGNQLEFFELTQKKSNVVVEDLKVEGLLNIFICPNTDQAVVCVVGINPNNNGYQALFSVQANGESKEILSSEGLILATNNSDYYITIETKDVKEDEDAEEGGSVHGPAKLHNLKDGSVKDLGFDLSGAGSVAYIGQDGRFYILDEDFNLDLETRKFNSYRSGSFNPKITKNIKAGSQVLKTESTGSDKALRFINTSGYSEDGTSLINSFDADQYLFVKKDSNTKLSVRDAKKVQADIKTCTSEVNGSDLQYFVASKTFKVLLNYGSSLNSDAKSYTECISRLDMYGYNFAIGVLDQESGKIVND